MPINLIKWKNHQKNLSNKSSKRLFITVLFTITANCKQHKCQSTLEWINSGIFTQIAIKMNEVVTYDNLGDSKKHKQDTKNTYSTISPTYILKISTNSNIV